MKGHSGRNFLQHKRLVVLMHVDSWQVFPIYIMAEAQMKKKFLFVSSKDSLFSKNIAHYSHSAVPTKLFNREISTKSIFFHPFLDAFPS